MLRGSNAGAATARSSIYSSSCALLRGADWRIFRGVFYVAEPKSPFDPQQTIHPQQSGDGQRTVDQFATTTPRMNESNSTIVVTPIIPAPALKAREQTIPPEAAPVIPAALDRLVTLYTLLKQPDKLKEYQALRSQYPK
jgi:hypothetical protein